MIAVKSSDGTPRLLLNTCQTCNPMNISYQVEDGNLTVKTADIDKYAGKFTTWKGPVE